MQKEKLIKAEELHRRVISNLSWRRRRYSDETWNLLQDLSQKSKWPKELRSDYNKEKANEYARMRAELRDKAGFLWLYQLDNGNIIDWLKKKGCSVDQNGRIDCSRLADKVLEVYLKTVLVKELETNFNLTGVKVKNKVTARCRNCLDFSRAEIKNSNI